MPSSPDFRSASRPAASSPSAAACGQGEVFGFAVEDIDFRGGWIHVNRQVRLVGTKPVFALPKGNKIRSVPLPAQLVAALKAHMKEFPPVEVTLPWAKPDSEPKTVRLLFVDEKSRAYNRSVFNMGAWKLALAAAGVIPPRERGARYLQAALGRRHARSPARLRLRLRVPGRRGEYQGTLRVPRPLGRGFTPRTYTHLLPSSGPRTRRAIDDASTEPRRSRGGRRRRPARRPGHISAPSETDVPRACPGRLTAPPRT